MRTGGLMSRPSCARRTAQAAQVQLGRAVPLQSHSFPKISPPARQTRDRTVSRASGEPGLSTTPKVAPSSGSSAAQSVKAFYGAINARDIETAVSLIAPDVVYEDMVYPEAKRGGDAVSAMFREQVDAMPDDLVFVIDEITGDQGDSCGLTWHVELKGGIPFPFGRGCSFYRVDPQGRIVYGRDIVEPTSKPGASTLWLLRALTPIVRAIGPAAAKPGAAAPLPLWGVYAAYWWFVMLSPAAPGNPVFATSPETLETVFHESLNFGFVNPFLHVLGITLVPDIPAHPTSEALFNFAAAWGAMLLPVMLADKRCPKAVNKVGLWTGTMFLTNLFFTPYMAQRLAPKEDDEGETEPPSGALVRGMGAFGAVLGAVSVAWFFFGRPDMGFGGPAERIAHWLNVVTTDRVEYAFVADLTLYSIYQFFLMKGAPLALRCVPFAGMAAWLLQGMPTEEAREA
ncbi:unnamed protein product [Pedinophyceae sp. YPF-701]|nr:unnamed protein product [Pedinophyceae sp. YPF-701]